MQMDRNINEDGCGKYAVINLRRLNELAGNPSTFERWSPQVENALSVLEGLGVLEWGITGTEGEFFLIKLKDRHAAHALWAYANSIHPTDPEFSDAVAEMARRAGERSPFCREPD